MSATISYKGETLETLNGGEYVTLHAKDKMMEDDILVEVANPVLQEKTITENGEYTADDGYDGLSKVTVNVESGGGAIDLANIPKVDSIDNPTASSPTAVRFDDEIYLLVEGEINDGI